MKLLDVAPIGEKTGIVFVDGPGVCGLRTIARKVYLDSEGRAFRAARVNAGLSLRETAQRLGLSAVDLSAVETGEKRPEDWAAFYDAAGLVRS